MTRVIASQRPRIRRRASAAIRFVTRATLVTLGASAAVRVGDPRSFGISIAAAQTPAPPPSASASAAPSPTSLASSAPAPAEPSDADKDRARALLDAGDEKVERGDLTGALADYKEAYRIVRVPTTGIEVARTLAKMRLLVEAKGVAAEVAELPAAPDEPAPFVEARTAARELVADLVARIPTLAVRVTLPTLAVAPEIRLDGKPLSRAEAEKGIALAPGKYALSVAATDHQTHEEEIVLKERDRTRVTVALLPVPPPPKPPPPPPQGQSPLLYAGIGVAGVGALATILTGVYALNATSKANTLCPEGRCPDESTRALATGHYAEANDLANGANVALAGTIAGAGLLVLGLVLSPSSAPAPPAKAGVSRVRLGPGGLWIQGHF